MSRLCIVLAKTETGYSLINEIHNNIYNDNNELKINRFTESEVNKTALIMVAFNEYYADHFRIVIIPTCIVYQCSIGINDDHEECIHIYKPPYDTTDKIQELSYEELKQCFTKIITLFNTNEQITHMETDELPDYIIPPNKKPRTKR